jgi:hypothetical protein
MARIIRSKLSQLYTWAPGIVESYDDNSRTADVQIAFDRVFDDANEPERIAPLRGVRVVFWGSKDFAMTVDVKKGTPVILLFAMRALDNYLETGEPGDPGDDRMHDISDAVALICPISDTDILPPGIDLDSITLRNKANTVNVKVKAETVEVNSGTTQIAVDNSKVTVAAGDTVMTIDASEVKTEVDIRGREILAYTFASTHPLTPGPGYVKLANHIHQDSIGGPTTGPKLDIPGPP